MTLCVNVTSVIYRCNISQLLIVFLIIWMKYDYILYKHYHVMTHLFFVFTFLCDFDFSNFRSLGDIVSASAYWWCGGAVVVVIAQ